MSLRKLTLALATVLFTTPVFAATTITVIENGEGGGEMSLTLDHASVKAGPAVFKVHNSAVGEEHEMVLVKLKSADQKIPLIASKHRVDEKQLKSLGEVADLAPGADGEMTADLTAGSYLLLCNLKGHYEAGMHAILTVTP